MIDRVWLALALVLGVVALSGTAGAQQVIGTASILAPAVLLSNNTGSLTTIGLMVEKGDGSVTISGPAIVGNSTTQSATQAAMYASQYEGMNFGSYNFSYYIVDSGSNVSGPSAGAAFTLLAVSALSGKQLLKNFTITGTISANGSIGEIGGAYDKVDAAKAAGLSFVLLPAVQNTSQEAALYVLIQGTFKIPLVEVANITEAAGFAFGQVPISSGTAPQYQLYSNLSVGQLPPAQLSCSNNCTAAPFGMITNYTLNFTQSEVNELSTISNFSAITSQFSQSLAQDRAIAQKGYLYVAADQSYLAYAYAFYFNNYLITEQKLPGMFSNVSASCNALQAPQMTSSNYEYVIGGELRQIWGEYTINMTQSAYANSIDQLTTDDLLSGTLSIANAQGWCNAAGQMYGIANATGGQDVVTQSSLAIVAQARINRSVSVGNGLYSSTAEYAYQQHDYPLAIIDADYGYAIPTAGAVAASTKTGILINESAGLAANATFGVWATEFANEAEFYVWEARHASNASLATGYADSAFSSALLASQLSNDTSLISGSFAPGTQPPANITLPTTVPQVTNQSGGVTPAYLSQYVQNLYVIVFVILVVNLVTLAIVLALVSTIAKMLKMQAGKVNGNGKTKQVRGKARKRQETA